MIAIYSVGADIEFRFGRDLHPIAIARLSRAGVGVGRASLYLKDSNMHDFRLVAARRLVWDEKCCREQPAFRAMVIRALDGMRDVEDLTPATQAEIDMLIKKLRAFGW